MAEETIKDYTRSFAEHGVELSKSGTNRVGDCPFCGKENHFFVNTKTGQWDCKVCTETGNLYRFLRMISEKYAAETLTEKYLELGRKRSVPGSWFRFAGFYFNPIVDEWMLPVVSVTKSVVDIRRWVKEKAMMSTSNCSLHMFWAANLQRKGKGTVWVCEGEWDAIALRALLKRVGSIDVVVGVPGAGTFKKEWGMFFQGWDVILAYDNDEPGRRGALRTYGHISSHAKSVKTVTWEESLPEGYDIRDVYKLVSLDKIRPSKVHADLMSRVGTTITTTDSEGKLKEVHTVKTSGNKDKPSDKKPISYDELIEIFKKWVRVDQNFIDALSVCLAVCIGNEIPGDPLWLYLVAPPGSGKTLILMSLQNSFRCVFRSNLSAASLVSGFKSNTDPSLLPLLDGKTAIFKDGTELISLPPDQKNMVYGTFRGAFDGHVHRSFGNGVEREYKVRFNMIIGVTPAIHGDSQATMGDRFLKYDIKETQESIEDKIRSAISSIGKEDKLGEALCEGVERFLNRMVDIKNLPVLSLEMSESVIALAMILSALRAQVDRHVYGDRDLRYRPTNEVATRIGKQLTKLAMMLAFVHGREEVSYGDYRLIQKVALDTSIGFHLDILAALVRYRSKPMTKEALAYVCRLPSQTVASRITDMEILGLAEKKRLPGWRGGGLAPYVYTPTTKMIGLWERAKISWSSVRLRAFPTVDSSGKIK